MVYPSPVTNTLYQTLRPMNRNTHLGLCKAVETSQGDAKQAAVQPAFCLLRVLVGRARARAVCRELCRLFACGTVSGESDLPPGLRRLAITRWQSERKVYDPDATHNGADVRYGSLRRLHRTTEPGDGSSTNVEVHSTATPRGGRCACSSREKNMELRLSHGSCSASCPPTASASVTSRTRPLSCTEATTSSTVPRK